jgi:AAA+ superfamily predicted ATPase
MEKKLGIGFPWINLDETRAAELLARLRKEWPDVYEGWELQFARYLRPRFYARHAVIEVRIARGDQTRVRYLLDGDDAMLPLEGRSDPIHAANSSEGLMLNAEVVLDYVRFFVFFLRGSDGPFTLLEAELELLPADGETVTPKLEELRSRVRPLRIGGQDGQGRFLVPATVAYDGTMWRTTLAISPGGEVEMIDEKDPVALDAARVPQCPYLDPPAVEEQAPASAIPVAAPPEEDATDQAAPVPPPRPQALEETVSDRETTRAVVSILLADAVRERVGNTLLKRFNSQTQADDPIAQLARFVSGSHPIIIIESDIPFVEDIVGGLLEPELGRKGKPAVDRAKAVSGDDSRCFLDLTGISAGDYFLISFHAYRSLWDAEWMAHELAIHSSTVLIGCTRQGEVPEPLRRVADLVLTLPRIDRRLFARIFASVFGTPPPANWDRGGPDWTRYLIAADFHAPRRLKLTASQAVQYLRQRVRARLRQVSAVDAPALASLHGLGEARQVAEDLIADIRAAQTGVLPWSAIDRGLLLVGPPGVGKTTLARSIARDCGVRFVVASAANWQAAGGLDVHLRAMRADFNEARRYAPSILFIDEIDSVGSREHLSGPNMQYQTEVINALLEQLQGFHANEPVVVIGATNNAEMVDPALRRAGRLDQTIVIPLPNVASLQRMFGDRLAAHRKEGNVADDVQERHLAELAFGLTGADVDFFVRGAARRARKRGRAICQEDLVAEVTRRPRGSFDTRRRPPEEMRRSAVHESGHAIAQLTNKGGDNDIALVTIIPRTDGTLGFVATVPREGNGMTRRSALERIETALAGRAAEELVYGADNVGLGAGGPSTSSDLAVATRIATLLVCQSGLGQDGGLHWTSTPTPAQLRQIDRLLKNSYRATLARLRIHRSLLDQLSEALVQEQELDRRQVRAILSSHEAQLARAPSRARATQRTRRVPPSSRRRR